MSSSKRTLYHTHLKYLAHENLLAKDVLGLIPKSTLHRWMHEDPLRYKDFDLNLYASVQYELVRHFAHDASAAKKIYAAYVRLSKFILSIVHTLPGFQREIKSQSKTVVSLVQRVSKSIGLKQTLRFFDISIQTFRNWAAQSLTPCFESIANSCNRVFYNQLSKPEVLKIKEMLSDKQFQFWPVSSIALHALRKNILPFSVNTWYKYANKLGLSRPKPSSRRKKNNISVRAERPRAGATVFTLSGCLTTLPSIGAMGQLFPQSLGICAFGGGLAGCAVGVGYPQGPNGFLCLFWDG